MAMDQNSNLNIFCDQSFSAMPIQDGRFGSCFHDNLEVMCMYETFKGANLS